MKPEPAAVWSEYGLQEAETARYEGAKGAFTISAWRLPDATNALAALQLLRSARPASATIQQRGNYVLQFDGFKPEVIARYDSGVAAQLNDFRTSQSDSVMGMELPDVE